MLTLHCLRYLSDVIATSWNCVVDTGVKEGDVVAVWGAGPIGQMTAEFAFLNGASRVIIIDCNWRLDYVKSKYPKVETVDFTELKGTKAVVTKLKEMCDGVGPDVALEVSALSHDRKFASLIGGINSSVWQENTPKDGSTLCSSLLGWKRTPAKS